MATGDAALRYAIMTSGDTLSGDVSSPQQVTQCVASYHMNVRFGGKNCMYLFGTSSAF
jgi:hypothetical protein